MPQTRAHGEVWVTLQQVLPAPGAWHGPVVTAIGETWTSSNKCVYNPQDAAPTQAMQSILQDGPEESLFTQIVLLNFSRGLSRPFTFSLSIHMAQGSKILLLLGESNPILLPSCHPHHHSVQELAIDPRPKSTSLVPSGQLMTYFFSI